MLSVTYSDPWVSVLSCKAMNDVHIIRTVAAVALLTGLDGGRFHIVIGYLSRPAI